MSLVVGKLSDKSSELWLTRELAILYCHRWGILSSGTLGAAEYFHAEAPAATVDTNAVID